MKVCILAVPVLCLLALPGRAQVKTSYVDSHPTPQRAAAPAYESVALWDQSATPMNYGYVDQAFTDYGSYSTFQVNDVSTGGAIWNVTKVTTYYTTGNGSWSPTLITSANLQVYPKTGTLPSDASDLPPEYTVPATLSLSGDGLTWILVGDTSGIAELQCISGDFWIGLTPVAAFLTAGQEFHWVAASTVGAESAARNAGGGFGLGTTWGPLSMFDSGGVIGPPYEMTIKLEGDVLTSTWAPFAGSGKPGLFGPVGFTPSGISCPGQPFDLSVTGLTMDFPVPATGTLFIGLGLLSAPFKGGIFVPTPDLPFILPTSATGDAPLSGTWPTGIPAGTPLYFQWWTKGLFGFAASDGWSVTAQ